MHARSIVVVMLLLCSPSAMAGSSAGFGMGGRFARFESSRERTWSNTRVIVSVSKHLALLDASLEA